MSSAKIPATTSSIIIPVPDLISSIPFTGPNFKMSNILKIVNDKNPQAKECGINQRAIH